MADKRNRPSRATGATPENTSILGPTTDVVFEPSAWMRGQIAQRRRDVARAVKGHDLRNTTVVAPLGRAPIGDPVEDRTCDRCRRHLDDGETMTCLVVQPTRRLMLVTGLCHECASHEGVDR